MTTTPRLYTIDEAAPLMGMSRYTLRDRVGLATTDPRWIPHLRIHDGRGVRFTDEIINAFLASHTIHAEPAAPVGSADVDQLPELAALAGIRPAGRR